MERKQKRDTQSIENGQRIRIIHVDFRVDTVLDGV